MQWSGAVGTRNYNAHMVGEHMQRQASMLTSHARVDGMLMRRAAWRLWTSSGDSVASPFVAKASCNAREGGERSTSETAAGGKTAGGDVEGEDDVGMAGEAGEAESAIAMGRMQARSGRAPYVLAHPHRWLAMRLCATIATNGFYELDGNVTVVKRATEHAGGEARHASVDTGGVD